MHELSKSTATKTETVVTETADGDGNIIETKSEVTRTYLYITVSHKTPEEMSKKHVFTDMQKTQLAELLSEKNAKLWKDVLYGISAGSGNIVNVQGCSLVMQAVSPIGVGAVLTAAWNGAPVL